MYNGELNSQVDTLVEPVSYFQTLGPGDELLYPFLAIPDSHQNAQGHAPLPRRSKRRSGDGIQRLLLVRIRHQDRMVLGPQVGLDAFPVLASPVPDVFTGHVGPDKGDGLDTRVVAQEVDGLWSTVDEGDDAGGHAGHRGQLDEHGGSAGVALGGFDEEGVTGSDGDRQSPQRDHRREIEPSETSPPSAVKMVNLTTPTPALTDRSPPRPPTGSS